MADNPETDKPDDAEEGEPGWFGYWRGQEAVFDARGGAEVKSSDDLPRAVDAIGHRIDSAGTSMVVKYRRVESRDSVPQKAPRSSLHSLMPRAEVKNAPADSRSLMVVDAFRPHDRINALRLITSPWSCRRGEKREI
jgi:hypothetical protein